MPLTFLSSMGLTLDLHQIVGEIVRFMKADTKRAYTIIIGTDSMGLSTGHADFVTAIVIHRRGNGGRYFWRRIELGKFHTLRDRIIKEVMLSLDAAQALLAILKEEAKDIAWDFEIHADIGANGETKVLIQEVVGMIRANNFEVKTKPDSYAASKVADRHT
ncbi:MAG: ribonuclease H-like YkuK family protein [Patescibacteria group bacterium]